METEYFSSRGVLLKKKFPVYLFHGAGEFLQKELADELARFLLDGGDAGDALLRFDCKENGIADVLNGVSQPQMFSPVTVVVAENAQEAKADEPEENGENGRPSKRAKKGGGVEMERFRRWLASPPADTHLVLIADGEVKKSGGKFVEKAYKEIEGKGCVVKFPRMYEDGVAKWLAARAARAGLKMSWAQAEFMVSRAGLDLRHLSNELDKLAMYCGGEREVDEAAIEALTTSADEELAFKLVEAVFDGRKDDAAKILAESRRGDVEPLQVTANLAAGIRMLWQARRLLEMGYLRDMGADYKRLGQSGVRRALMAIPDEAAAAVCGDEARSIMRKTPFYAYKCVRQARRLRIPILERWLYFCARADRALKGITRGAGPPDVVFDRMIADMMKEFKPAEVPTRRAPR